MATKRIGELSLRSDFDATCNVPVDDSTQSYRVTGAQMFTYIRGRIPSSILEIANVTIVPSVGASALTIAIKTLAAADASSTDPIRVAFRSSTLTSGAYVLRELTGALSVVVSSGSTLGQVSAQPSRIWIYMIDNAGTIELAVSHKRFRDDELVSTTAEGGAGAADSATVMYSTTARSNVACRLIGYIDNTQTTAGTWASAGTQVQVTSQALRAIPPTIQVFNSGSGTYYKPAGCTRIRVRMVGPGGGGSTSGTASNNAGSNGAADTTFDTLTAGKGSGAAAPGSSGGGAGGTATVGAGWTSVLAVDGASGNCPGYGAAAVANVTSILGGPGGSSYFGGAGGGTASGTAGNARTNSGSGGAGGGPGGTTGSFTGAGGGAGAYVEAIHSSPAASYSYAVGGAGAGGTPAGTSGNAGGSGGAGKIIVEEFYD